MKVELSIHAMGLRNVAGAMKGTSDPFAVVTSLATTQNSKPHVLGKTETVKNNLSPSWVKVFVLDYELGTPYKVAVNVFDEVRKSENKSMGSAVFDIAELLGARGNSKAKKIKKGGTIFAHVRKAKGSGLLRLQMTGHKLKNVEGMLSKSDPFFELSRMIESAGGQTWDNVYRSSKIKNNLNPAWEPVIMDLSILCGGDLDAPIQIAVFDYESNGKHKNMGKAEVSVNGLKRAAERNDSVELIHKNKNVGSLVINRAEVSGVEQVTDRMAAMSTPSAPAPAAAPVVAAARPAAAAPVGHANFVDYVSGGCDLNVVVAIDFTGSNGDPRKPGTLHHLSSTNKNQYEMAISAIVSILAKYDSDQMFPVLGFGAKYNGIVRHCFQCGNAEEVRGVQGVLDAYHQVFRSGLIMSGPTVFNEVIEMASAKAEASMREAQQIGSQAYTILLILTDGAVSDAQATAACLDRVSNSPLSVVIVGVGTADFSAMQFLDDSSQPGKRDIAQFVEFNKHSRNSVALTSETLQEIPDQLVEYFQRKGIPPMPPLQRTDSTMSIGVEEEEIDLSLDIGEEEIVITGGGNDFVDGFGRTHI